MLERQTFFGSKNLVDISVERIKTFVEKMKSKGVRVLGAFSGGKDSCVLKELERRAGTNIEWFYNYVGIDPPELVSFIREHHPDVELKKPEVPFFARMRKKMFPPMIKQRYCCEILKEYHGDGLILTGVRAAESLKRAQRLSFEPCKTSKDKWFLNPIIDWEDSDVWEFLKGEGIPYCSLYDEGFKRLGCILCPMTSEKQKRIEAERWPKMANAWSTALWACHNLRMDKGKEGLGSAKTKEDVLTWYFTFGETERVDGDQQCFRFE